MYWWKSWGSSFAGQDSGTPGFEIDFYPSSEIPKLTAAKMRCCPSWNGSFWGFQTQYSGRTARISKARLFCPTVSQVSDYEAYCIVMKPRNPTFDLLEVHWIQDTLAKHCSITQAAFFISEVLFHTQKRNNNNNNNYNQLVLLWRVLLVTNNTGPNTCDLTKGGRVRRKIRKVWDGQFCFFLQGTRMQHIFPVVDLYLPFWENLQCFPYRSFPV